MKTVIQRVETAAVYINNKLHNKINEGLVVFLGVQTTDNEKDVLYLAQKIPKLRIFSDDNNKMNKSLLDIKGEVLLISQFTLYANYKNGNRPDFINAARPKAANDLYNLFINLLKEKVSRVKTGVFGANMNIELLNKGPVTIILES